MKHKNNNNEGFTLIEVTLAMVILVVAILSALMIIITCVQQREVSHEMDLAKNGAVAKLQEIRAYDFDTIFNDYNGTNFGVEGLMPIPVAGAPATATGFTYVDNSNSELLDITVAISWTSVTQAEVDLEIRSMVTRKE